MSEKLRVSSPVRLQERRALGRALLLEDRDIVSVNVLVPLPRHALFVLGVAEARIHVLFVELVGSIVNPVGVSSDLALTVHRTMDSLVRLRLA